MAGDIKNTGIAGNQLSDLDYPQVLKDSHNKTEHALDVIIANGFIPKRYSKITYELKDFGDGTKDVEYINFYGFGEKQLTKLDFPSTFLGAYELTAFSFQNQTTELLANKYIEIYDEIGKVVPWFNIDEGGVEPVVSEASRYISIGLTSGDSSATIASKFSTLMNNDSKFSSGLASNIVAVQSSTKGNKTNATQGNTSIQVAITDGYDSINGKYLYIYSANDERSYYLLFTDGTAIDPAPSGKTKITLNYSALTNLTELNNLFVSTINEIADFYAYNTGSLYIQNRQFGESTSITDVDSGTTINTITSGESGELISRIRISFDTNNIIEAIERVE